MKHFLGVVFVLLCTYCPAQKYILVDKKMSLPVAYTNAVTMGDNLKGYFPIDKTGISKFLKEIDAIASLLNDPKKKKPGTIDIVIGSTTLHGFTVSLSAEERMDITITTDYGNAKSSMHLCDAKISNANNAYYINTWLKYLRGYIN